MSKLRGLALLGSLGLALGFGLGKARGVATQRLGDLKRGRTAAHPWRIPLLGWKDAIARAWRGAFDHRILSVAASVAFFALLSVLPALSVLISIYGLFGDPAALAAQIPSLIELAPPAAQGILLEHARLSARQGEGLTLLNLGLAFAVATWSASAAVKGLFDGLNVIYGETEKRGVLRFNAEALVATVTGACLLATGLGVVALVPGAIAALSLEPGVLDLIRWLRWPLLVGAGVLGIALLYWIGPSRRPARIAWVLPGAVFAALLWAAASAGFSWYAVRLSAYDTLYGPLAAVVVFMTWLWMSAAIALFGAEINAELEHQTAEDTTMGAPRPPGSRGAVVADRVGPAVARDKGGNL